MKGADDDGAGVCARAARTICHYYQLTDAVLLDLPLPPTSHCPHRQDVRGSFHTIGRLIGSAFCAAVRFELRLNCGASAFLLPCRCL